MSKIIQEVGIFIIKTTVGYILKKIIHIKY